MNDTRIALTPALRLRFTSGHDASLALQKPWDMPALAGSGAFRSTARDMMRFLSAYSRPTGTSLELAAALALEPRRPGDDPSVSVGLGWHIVERQGRRFAAVNGGTDGYAAFAGFSMSSGTSVVVLSNSARGVDDIGWHLMDPSIPVQSVLVAERTEIVLEPSSLDRFVGRYGLSPTGVITIAREGDSLWARIGELNYQLFAEGRQEFFMKAVEAQVALPWTVPAIPRASHCGTAAGSSPHRSIHKIRLRRRLELRRSREDVLSNAGRWTGEVRYSLVTWHQGIQRAGH